MTLRVTTGHGTENDFVLVLDPDGSWDPSPRLVAALCDRRAGVGGDGLIRAVRDDGTWFMDYRNADGSLAEMCGNGVRVFVALLLREGLVDAAAAAGGGLVVRTRSGDKRVVLRPDGLLAADLGAWRVVGEDVRVAVPPLPGPLPGVSLDLGNPHVVVALPGEAELAAVDLGRPPVVDPAPEHGTNVELVVPVAVADGRGHVRMRVHERGSGETRSCGTGAAAAALATRLWVGEGAPGTWTVDVPGGRLEVSVQGDLREGPSVVLAGPAELVADAEVSDAWLAARA